MRVAISGPPKWKSIEKNHPGSALLAKKWLSVQLDVAALKGSVEAATSLQLGLDTFFAALCASKGIPYIVFLSCDNQDALWDEEKQAIFRDLLQKATEVQRISTGRYKEGCIHRQSEAITKWLAKEDSTLLLVKNRVLGKVQQERKKALQGSAKIVTYKV